MKPFIKWAGGKSQLLNKLLPLVPKSYNRYIEPFLGGGALYLFLKPEKAWINDLNEDLINTWKCIKDDCQLLEEKLNDITSKHNQAINKEAFYLGHRNKEYKENIDRACRFIYRNKTCFNGLYRVNSKNEFNVPFNKKMTLTSIYQKENLEAIANFLITTNPIITAIDYKEVIMNAKENDFLYLDPPYTKEDNKKQIFTSYTAKGFDDNDQKELANLLREANDKGVKWILSNNNSELINQLYDGFEKIAITTNRAINSNPHQRSLAAKELIITNINKIDLLIDKFLSGLSKTSYILNKVVNWKTLEKRALEFQLASNDLRLLLTPTKIEEDYEDKLNLLFSDVSRRKSFKILPLLIAFKEENKKQFIYWIYQNNKRTAQSLDVNDLDSIKSFIEVSGLKENLFYNDKILDIYSYVTGVNIGINSNSHKNVSGKFFEDEINFILDKFHIQFEKQYSLKINEHWTKRFDFHFRIGDNQYFVETNYFNDSGSKIKSEVENFIELQAELIKINPSYKFIWISDGKGWQKMKPWLHRIFTNIDFFFNIEQFINFISTSLNQLKLYNSVKQSITEIQE